MRNRDRLLAVAKTAFTRGGAEINLDDVRPRGRARGRTLYRHFPTRDALIEAVYRTEVDTLAAAAARLISTDTPLEALRNWMLLFVDYIARPST